MHYVGIDWAYSRAAWCARSQAGEITGEGMLPADENGLARLVNNLGTEAKAAVEMMSGAVWVRDRLADAGWQVQVAHAGKVRDVAPLACKTDKVDARVLAELCRRDLVPELWVPPLEDRELRERLRRRMHLVRMRASAMNRIFGLLTQWGLRISLRRLREPEAMQLLEDRGVPEVWRASIAEHLEDRRARRAGLGTRARAGPDRGRRSTRRAAADDAGHRPAPRPHLRRGDRRRRPLLIGGQAGRLCGPGSPDQPVGGALAQRSALEAGSRTLRWAAVEAANQAWRESNPWHRLYREISDRHGRNPAKSAVARKLLIAAWHMLSRDEPFKAARPRGGASQPAPASSVCFLAA